MISNDRASALLRARDLIRRSRNKATGAGPDAGVRGYDKSISIIDQLLETAADVTVMSAEALAWRRGFLAGMGHARGYDAEPGVFPEPTGMDRDLHLWNPYTGRGYTDADGVSTSGGIRTITDWES